MFNQSISTPSDDTNGMRLIRFFRVVGLIGEIVIITRILILIGFIGGILYLLPL